MSIDREEQASVLAPAASGSDSPDAFSLDDEVSRAERKRLRRQWAQLIRHIYESDPSENRNDAVLKSR